MGRQLRGRGPRRDVGGGLGRTRRLRGRTALDGPPPSAVILTVGLAVVLFELLLLQGRAEGLGLRGNSERQRVGSFLSLQEETTQKLKLPCSLVHTLGGSGGGTFGLMMVLDLLKSQKTEFKTLLNKTRVKLNLYRRCYHVTTEAMVSLPIFIKSHI